jgi:hypothetical protein
LFCIEKGALIELGADVNATSQMWISASGPKSKVYTEEVSPWLLAFLVHNTKAVGRLLKVKDLAIRYRMGTTNFSALSILACPGHTFQSPSGWKLAASDSWTDSVRKDIFDSLMTTAITKEMFERTEVFFFH